MSEPGTKQEELLTTKTSRTEDYFSIRSSKLSLESRTDREVRFGIVCNDENDRVISNARAAKVWDALFELIFILLRDSSFSTEALLFDWKKNTNHLATPRESYAWRAALEEIKNSDLGIKCGWLKEDEEKFVLVTDKPTMLKIAGEVTNGLLHSYTSRHKISFVQIHKES